MNKSTILPIFLIIVLASCVNTNAHFPPVQQLIILDNDLTLYSDTDEIKRLNIIDSNSVWELSTLRYQGGATYLFGMIKIKEVDKYSENRIRVIDDKQQTILYFSINDLIESNQDTINLNEYLY